MFNASRSDLPLRTEATKLFEECNVNSANVVCSSDLSLEELQTDGKLKLSLVDHNMPTEDQRDMVQCVVEIVDHHQDDSSGVYDESVEKTISAVGSCSTLVASDFLSHKRAALEENPDLVKLLLGAILLDTDNLSEITGIATEKDSEVVAVLSSMTESSCDDLFNELSAAKFDTSGLSAYDLLRRDYKDAPSTENESTAGGSTVPESGTSFLDREDAADALQQFSGERGVDVLLVNYVFYSDVDRQERERQIVVYCPNDKLRVKVCKYLLADETLGLKEVGQEEQADGHVRIFDQDNTSISRKKVLILINAALGQEDIPSFKSFVDDIASVKTVQEVVQVGSISLCAGERIFADVILYTRVERAVFIW